MSSRNHLTRVFPCVSHFSLAAGPRMGVQRTGSSLLSLVPAGRSGAAERPAPAAPAHGSDLGRGDPENRQDLLCSAFQEGITLERARPELLLSKPRPDAPGHPGRRTWNPYWYPVNAWEELRARVLQGQVSNKTPPQATTSCRLVSSYSIFGI